MKKKMTGIFLSAFIILLPVNINHADTLKFKISTSSMNPTLYIGDYIEVTPVADFKTIRGSIIAYHPPVNGTEADKIYCHRCIAIEGDVFAIKHGRVWLNGKEKTELYTKGETSYEAFVKINIEGIVPAGKVIVLGDNRMNAADSRYFGYLPVEKIVGTVRKIK